MNNGFEITKGQGSRLFSIKKNASQSASLATVNSVVFHPKYHQLQKPIKSDSND